jgi:hypothetical protein
MWTSDSQTNPKCTLLMTPMNPCRRMLTQTTSLMAPHADLPPRVTLRHYLSIRRWVSICISFPKTMACLERNRTCGVRSTASWRRLYTTCRSCTTSMSFPLDSLTLTRIGRLAETIWICNRVTTPTLGRRGRRTWLSLTLKFSTRVSSSSGTESLRL